MRPLRKLAFLVEEFSNASPAQHLLDRFLLGYPVDGRLHQPKVPAISIYQLMTNDSGVDRRDVDFKLQVASTAEQALEDADAVVIVPRRPGSTPNDRFLQLALEKSPANAACFVHGALSSSLGRARDALSLARSRGIALLAGTPTCVTWRLPAIELPAGTQLTEALIVVQRHSPNPQNQSPPPRGSLAGAELNAVEGLWPVIERRAGGESGIRQLRCLEDRDVWRAADKGAWSWPLLAAALSRSHSPQGDPVLDGRTQDIVGLGLVPKLAREPLAWQLEHHDGLRTSILVLDGVVADSNFAVRAKDGQVFSAQLFRGPSPVDQQFSLLTAAVEKFFRTGHPPWPVERSLLIAGLLETFRKPASRGRAVATPELGIAYSNVGHA